MSDPLDRIDVSAKKELRIERECSRHYLLALQYIAEMVGLDTSVEPHEGVLDVVNAVETFVKKAGGGLTLDEARKRCAEHWLEQTRLREAPPKSVHARAANAYYKVFDGAAT